jgi:tetratricopeptide (TPR) repeat protein
MAKWTAFPHADAAYAYTPATLKKHWARLHKGDCEPFPKDPKAIDAWIAYHRGDFGKAWELGADAGASGSNAACKAANIYAFYLEKAERRKLELYQQVIARCEALQASEPGNANAFYLCGNALGRYSQGISVAKALAQGLGTRVRDNLATALRLQPAHAEAHVALGAFHAEVIDKVGAMIGGVTYGAKRDTAIKAFRTALELIPHSAIARTVYADALVMLDGKKAMKEAEKLYAEAAECEPMDAMERLDVEAAKAEIE